MFFTIALFALLLLGALVFILAPVLRTRRSRREARGAEVEALQWEKTALLLLIRDLDFDHSTGKILEADYAASRADAEARAMTVIRRLDLLGIRETLAGEGQDLEPQGASGAGEDAPEDPIGNTIGREAAHGVQ